MSFLSIFWAAYLPVVVLFIAAFGEWVGVPRRAPSQFEQNTGPELIHYTRYATRQPPARHRAAAPLATMPERAVTLHEARLRRSNPLRQGAWQQGR